MVLMKKLSDFSNALKRQEEAHAKVLEDNGGRVLFLSPDPLDYSVGLKCYCYHLTLIVSRFNRFGRIHRQFGVFQKLFFPVDQVFGQDVMLFGDLVEWFFVFQYLKYQFDFELAAKLSTFRAHRIPLFLFCFVF